jgi:hypothetical protein
MSSIFGNEVPVNEMPAWTKPLIKGRPRCYIKLVADAVIPTNMTDWNVRYIFLKAPDGKVQKYTDTGYESAINDPQGLFFGVQGGPLPKGAEILIINSYPRMVELLTTEMTIRQGVQIAPPLSDRHKMILVLYMSLKSFARPEYLRKMKARDWEIDELKALGMINGRNALTLAGRQVADAFRTEGGGFKQEWAAKEYRDITPTSALQPVRSENTE